ncbi:MAG: hypothetical protein MUC97_12510 [Bernardetiaceae bacterium]|jgi:hypothetical protein|nr:hypothetical protein [Bernardetiaceae bacterium]
MFTSSWFTRPGRFLARLLVLAIGLGACGEGQPTAVLEMYVLNSFGNEMRNASISLYNNEDAWRNGTGTVKEPSVTDSTGVVRFAGLASGRYFFDAIKGDTNNWELRTSTEVQSIGSFYVNRVFVVITPNRTGLLAATGGRRWRIGRVLQGTQDVTNFVAGCEVNDVLIFYKGNQLVEDEGATRCSPNDPQQVNAHWQFSAAGTEIEVRRGEVPLTAPPSERWTIVGNVTRNGFSVQKRGAVYQYVPAG